MNGPARCLILRIGDSPRFPKVAKLRATATTNSIDKPRIQIFGCRTVADKQACRPPAHPFLVQLPAHERRGDNSMDFALLLPEFFGKRLP
eukprot:6206858-Pleurochrysis_carterae.AAC.4